LNKIVTIIGARPQFIKAAAVSRTLLNSQTIQEVIVHTGQHFDTNMSQVFFSEMAIPEPHYNLEISSLTHGAMTGRMIEKIEAVLLDERPDWVMVYGDTNSTLAGALAAKKLNIKVAHVEAGLRSFNMKMPEEINRILTDRISDILFCPTDNAVQNLQKEGFDHFGCTIRQVGDVMYDAARYYGNMSSERSDIISRLGLHTGEFVLCTVHRQENTDNPDHLRAIFDAINKINREKRVVLPLHPRTRKIIDQLGIRLDFEPIEPVGYFDIIELMKNTDLLITDSGGMQKEAYFFGKYCITLRPETEWVELVDNGFNTLTGSNPELVLKAFSRFSGKRISNPTMLYGQGHACEKIISVLSEFKV